MDFQWTKSPNVFFFTLVATKFRSCDIQLDTSVQSYSCIIWIISNITYSHYWLQASAICEHTTKRLSAPSVGTKIDAVD